LVFRAAWTMLKAIMRWMKFLKIGSVVVVCAAAGVAAFLIVSDRMSQTEPT